ncbi:MAG: hypothetical protein EON55_07820 [Alphaproteobacteria bacterium]|nr:MAG: hypothetical protein EON55_07820 [Alphaproteobacteria bacterium]
MAKRVTAEGPVDGPWTLPDGWRWERLDTVGRWGSGGTPNIKTPRYYGGNIPWFRSGELRDRPLADPEIKITEEGLQGSSAKLIAPGAVLIAMYGATVGKLAISTCVCATNQAVAFCIPDPEKITARYLFFYLLSIRRHLRDQAQGGAQPNISQSLLKEQIIPLPPIGKQLLIVGRIDELFAEIGNGETALARVRDDLATWRKALLKAAVTGELTADWRAANLPTETGADLLDGILADRRARWDGESKNRGKRYPQPITPGVGALPGLPVGWCWATMDQLSWSSGYGTSEKCSAEHAGTPILRIPNVRRGVVSLDDLKYTTAPLALNDGRELSIGDLLIVRTNGSDDLIGRAALVLTPPPQATYFASYLIRLRLLGTVEVLHWVALLIDSPIFRASVLQSIASSAGQYNLSLSKIETFAVPVPPLDEIRAVISRVYAAQADAAEGAQSLDAAGLTSTTLRQSILAAAFRGDLV